ncbi:MAG: plastocyanin/azurin family copper-binding protein [Gemmatimonadaceae bacterium]
MRFYGIALMASAVVLGACAGGDNAAADTSAVAIDNTTPAAAAPAAGTPASGTGTMAPITGTTHEVRMLGDAQGYRYEPANITVKPGDGIRFVMVSGGPHNVAFDVATVPAAVQAQLDANISEKMGQLSSTMKMNVGETITVSFANIPAGKYPYHCTPHLALGMKGEITVQ